MATLLTGLMTIGGWITMSVNESQLSSGETSSLELSSLSIAHCSDLTMPLICCRVSGAFLTGIYGLWNLYTFAVMILFSPAKVKDDYGKSSSMVVFFSVHSYRSPDLPVLVKLKSIMWNLWPRLKTQMTVVVVVWLQKFPMFSLQVCNPWRCLVENSKPCTQWIVPIYSSN